MLPKSLHTNTPPESGGAAALAGSGVVGEGPERRVLVALHFNRRAGGMGEGRGRGPLSSTTCTPCSGPCRAQSRTDREGVLSLTNKTSPHSTVSCLSIIMDRPAAIRLTRLVPLGCLPPGWYCAQWPVTLPLLLLCLPFLLRRSAQTCLGHSFADMEKDVDAPGEFRTITSPSLYIRSLVSAPAAKTSSDSALGVLPALSAT